MRKAEKLSTSFDQSILTYLLSYFYCKVWSYCKNNLYEISILTSMLNETPACDVLGELAYSIIQRAGEDLAKYGSLIPTSKT